MTSSVSSAWSLPKPSSMRHRQNHINRNAILPIYQRGGNNDNDDDDEEEVDNSMMIHDDQKKRKKRNKKKQSFFSSLLSKNNRDISTTYRWSINAVLVSSFLNLLGFTMAGPITPALGTHFNLEVGASFGSLTSAYPLGMLVGLFCWPTLSDTLLGRPTVMALSLLGTGCGLGLQSYLIATKASLRWFLASRVLTGTFAGSSPVSKAYLADIASALQQRKPDQSNTTATTTSLAQLLAYRDAASTLAFLVGPLMGGIAYSKSSSLEKVISISAIASLLAGIVVGFIVKSIPTSNKNKNKEKETNSIQEDTSSPVLSCPLGTSLWAGVATVCIISFLFHVGDSTFHAFFSVLLKQNSLSASNIGLAYTCLAAISFTISTAIGRRGGRKRPIAPVSQCAAGLTAIGLGLLIMGWFSTTAVPPILFAAGLYYCGIPLYSPTIPTMLLQCVPPHRRGFILGLDGIINTLARIVSPLFMGTLYKTHGPKAAFSVAGTAALIAAALAVIKRIFVFRATTTTTTTTTMKN